MKIEEYIDNIKLNNFEDYLLLNQKKNDCDYLELLNSNFIKTQELYIKEINETNNIIDLFNIIRHIFLYKLIFCNIINDNSNLVNLFYFRLNYNLYDKDKIKKLIYCINHNSHESFSFEKHIIMNKKKYIILNDNIISFLNLLKNKYKISKKISQNMYFYYNNNDIKKFKITYINNYNFKNIDNSIYNNINYIIKFNRIILKNYNIIIKLDFDIVIYYSINNIINNINKDISNLLLNHNNNYSILPYSICKIKYIDNSCSDYYDLINNCVMLINIPNNISKLVISNYYIKNIDFNNWFKNNFENKNNMNENHENESINILDNNESFLKSFIETNNVNSKSYTKHFYIIYSLLTVILAAQSFQLILLIRKI